MSSNFWAFQAALLCAWLLTVLFINRRRDGAIPTIRRWPALFPESLDRLSYNHDTAQLIEEGYQKYKDRPFRVLKMDMDLIVIPLKYAAELRAVTSDKLDPLTASFDDNAGSLTGILLESELHSEAIHRRLTPRLPRIIPVVVDELRFAFYRVLPQCEGNWVPVSPYDMVLDLSTRAAARVFVGEPTCRDERFLQTSASYSRNTFNTIASFRNLGSVIGSLFGTLVPSVAHAREQLRYVQRLLGSEVERRRASPDQEQDDFLQWCMDLSRTKEEAAPEALAHRTLGILSMAVVHTTAMATTHLLLDMISNPELLESLKREQKEILPAGWAGISQKSMLDMRLLDSLMRESQRHNPVGEFTFRRIVRKPITLSDGYQLRPGQQIAIPAKNINMDNSVINDAQSFDPYRWAQEKSASASFSHSAEPDTQSTAVDLDYWMNHSVPLLDSLMRSSAAYSPTDRAAHIRVLSDHVLPNLGPRPSMAHARSLLTKSGSPFQPSLNVSSREPQVRYCWEPLGAHGGSESDLSAVEAAREVLSSLSKAFGFSSRWINTFLSAFAPTMQEAKDVQTKLAGWLRSFTSAGTEASSVDRLPFVLIAFDLKGSNTSVKTYFNPKAKEIATGKPCTETVFDILRNLEPPLDVASIDALEQFLAERPVPSAIELVAVDCVNETSLPDARVKFYVHARSNSFNTVRDYVTLGGRLQDESTLKGLAILRDIWHLLLQEPEGAVDDDFEKPLNDSSIFCQRLYFSFEMRPGRKVPEVKTYLPTWNYVRSDEETVKNYEEVFRRCGHAWGEEGRYREVFEMGR
ncbi:Ent-kaurene oxidase-like protein [Hapsidospora chrysogenum ATCC 11550]|uniref:Ent-kaurene oxidase-like protein n=1 Tax=Hapsidospora chrysogenum (strain ATCC 11550 / CBS 779.69 / DSM 880 / IAM 14645 / JCM 23072 / IMI 49137) TaxID=857340 RepID=A0A086T3Y5_HAPC1|nr:Ent-kaurene oxidase-like protein [Hapsidospora chrysogenum ATCC 11550]